MITENLSTLKIHKLTQEQYDREREAGRIDETAIYLTPEERIIIDETLSIPGAAADAKAVGDRINNIKVGDDIVVDTVMSNTSTNPVQNKVVNAAINGRLPLNGATLSSDFSISAANEHDGGRSIVKLGDDDAVEFAYVRNDVENKINIMESGIYINPLVEPTEGSQPATKRYVDNTKQIIDQQLDAVDNTIIEFKEEIQYIVGGLDSEIDELERDMRELIGTESVEQQIQTALSSFSSGKTLTEHLTEEMMILTDLHYGDKLPGEDGEEYTHVPGRIFFRKVSD